MRCGYSIACRDGLRRSRALPAALSRDNQRRTPVRRGDRPPPARVSLAPSPASRARRLVESADLTARSGTPAPPRRRRPDRPARLCMQPRRQAHVADPASRCGRRVAEASSVGPSARRQLASQLRTPAVLAGRVFPERSVRQAGSTSRRAAPAARRRATRAREAHIVTFDGSRMSLFAPTSAGSARDRRRPTSDRGGNTRAVVRGVAVADCVPPASRLLTGPRVARRSGRASAGRRSGRRRSRAPRDHAAPGASRCRRPWRSAAPGPAGISRRRARRRNRARRRRRW